MRHPPRWVCKYPGENCCGSKFPSIVFHNQMVCADASFKVAPSEAPDGWRWYITRKRCSLVARACWVLGQWEAVTVLCASARAAGRQVFGKHQRPPRKLLKWSASDWVMAVRFISHCDVVLACVTAAYRAAGTGEMAHSSLNCLEYTSCGTKNTLRPSILDRLTTSTWHTPLSSRTRTSAP